MAAGFFDFFRATWGWWSSSGEVATLSPPLEVYIDDSATFVIDDVARVIIDDSATVAIGDELMAETKYIGKRTSNEVLPLKVTPTSDTLGSDTIASATATIGPSSNPTKNPAAATAVSTTASVATVTITAREWTPVGTKTYIGVAITTSGGRVITEKFVADIVW